jgi:hypothetical protein
MPRTLLTEKFRRAEENPRQEKENRKVSFHRRPMYFATASVLDWT